jgi:hypothetical protein
MVSWSSLRSSKGRITPTTRIALTLILWPFCKPQAIQLCAPTVTVESKTRMRLSQPPFLAAVTVEDQCWLTAE